MPDIILPPAERPAEYRLVLTATSTAQANGVDTNSATARLSRHGQASGGQLLVFTLSGNAVFTSGARYISVTTNSQGEATVFFTDTRQETVLVTCHYYQTQARESSRFVENAQANTNISVEVIKNEAVANGFDYNIVRYSVYDAFDNPLPDVPLRFELTGNAELLFADDITDFTGHAIAAVTNFVSEQVLLTTEVANAPQVVNRIYLQFVQDIPASIIIANVITDRQPANSVTPNQVAFTVLSLFGGTPLAGVQLVFSVTGSARLATPTGITGPDGSFTVGLTNPFAESVTLTASVSFQPLPLNNVVVIWI